MISDRDSNKRHRARVRVWLFLCGRTSSPSCCMLGDESFEKRFEAVGCRCWMTQLQTAASVIKSSAVQNLHTDGPVNGVTTPGCAIEMEWYAASPTTCADFKEPCVWNMSLKTSEEDRLEDLGSSENHCLFSFCIRWFGSWGNDGLWLAAGLVVPAHHCPPSQQRLRGQERAGWLKRGREGGIKGSQP